MSAADPPEAALLRAAQTLLAARYPELAGAALLQAVVISVETPGMAFEVSVRPRGFLPLPAARPAERPAPPNSDAGDPDDADLTPTELSIMTVLRASGETLKQRTIARRAGKKYGPHFRTCCRRLADEGRIVQDDGGWREATAADASDPDAPDS